KESRQERPFHRSHIGGCTGGKLRLLPERNEQCFCIPEDEPEGNAERCPRPEALPDRAAYFTHRMAAAAKFGRCKRRGGGDDTNAENHHCEIEIGAKRARSQCLRS